MAPSVVVEAAPKNTGILPRVMATTSLTMAFFSSTVSRVVSPAEPSTKIWLVPYLIWRLIRVSKPLKSILSSGVKGVGMATKEPSSLIITNSSSKSND